MYRHPAREPSRDTLPADAELVIDSPLSPTKVMDAIADEVLDDRGSWREWLTGDHEYLGCLSEDALRIQRRQRGYNNSFAPVFHGRVQPHGEGSRIVGRFGLHRAVVVLSYVMAGIGVLFVAMSLLGLVLGEAHPSMVGFLVLGLAMALLMPQARKLQFPRSHRDDIEALLRRAAQPGDRR